MSIGYVTDATEEQILALYRKENPVDSSKKPFQGFIHYLEVHQKIKESALISFDTLNKMRVTHDQIVEKINSLIEIAKSNPTNDLIDKIFMVTIKDNKDETKCHLCDHKEIRILYRITNIITKQWFEFEVINIHSLDKHHSFSNLGTDSHWQLFPTKICRILQLYHENVQDNIPKDPLIPLIG